MAKNKDNMIFTITPDLILRYIENRVTFEEWLSVFSAEMHDDDIMELIKKLRGIYNSEMEVPSENPRSMNICKVIDLWKTAKLDKENSLLIKHAVLPIERMAAKSDSNDCVIRCEQFVLEKYGIDRSLIDLRINAEVEGWREKEGTPLHYIGWLIENSKTPDGVKFSLARFTIDSMRLKPIEQLRYELKTGCQVILAISQGGEEADHAIVVTDVTTDLVEVFDPSKGYGTIMLTHSELLEQWEFSNYYMVSITLCGRRPYTPHPLDLSDISLEGIENLVPILMENAHEVWAKARQKDGWKYGPKRNKGKKLSPFMLPYSEMADKDKETDRVTVETTLKFLKKIGYSIEKKNDTDFVFHPNERNAAGEYIANPADLDSVQLPESIIKLEDFIAEDVHEEWSRQRMEEGWVYGDKNDNDKKTNEDLVPYCELMQSEKQYDCDMAYDTLRMLYKMGYVIEKKPSSE